MKKHICIILLAALLLLCACQPTPDEPVVLQKDQDLMIEKGSATLPPEESYTPPEVPKRYQYDYEEGTLTVHVDAAVTAPDVPMPIARVRACGYEQEAVKRLFALLADGDTLMTQPQKKMPTKEDYEEALQQAIQMLDDGSYKDADITEEEWREHIEQLKEAYNSAPFAEAVPTPTVADGSFYPNQNGDRIVNCADAYSKDRDFMIWSADDRESVFRYDRHNTPPYTMCNAREITADSELPEKLGMTYAEAAAEVNTLLEATSEPFRIKRVYLIDDEQRGNVDGIVADASHYALAIQCQRTFGGVPVATDVSDAWESSETYARPWREESFWIVIDRDGIVSLDWLEPMTTGETVSESCNLMPFSEVKAIAEKMFRVVYLQYTDPRNPAIDRIEIDLNVGHVDLELIRIREQDNVTGKDGFLIPAWIFYGTVLRTSYDKDGGDGEPTYSHYGLGSGNRYYEGDAILLCINAIDGTIIDPMLGY
ncbi:MAG: hypothetical protein IKP38_04320 [Clostridia bacterium]|nr:hypothetical protein [Clostridia bacterium]